MTSDHTPLIPAKAGIQSYETEFGALDPHRKSAIADLRKVNRQHRVNPMLARGDERQMEWANTDLGQRLYANSPASNQMRRGALFRGAFLCAKGQAF